MAYIFDYAVREQNFIQSHKFNTDKKFLIII